MVVKCSVGIIKLLTPLISAFVLLGFLTFYLASEAWVLASLMRLKDLILRVLGTFGTFDTFGHESYEINIKRVNG